MLVFFLLLLTQSIDGILILERQLFPGMKANRLSADYDRGITQ